MQITLYRRTYPVAGAPVAFSLMPYSADQRHTFTVGGKVYEGERCELQITVPSDAKLDVLKNLLCWSGPNGPVKSTAKEVFELAEAGLSGFRLGQ